MLFDNLVRWDGVGGRLKKERTYVYLWLIHLDVWQKPTQHCKAIILQLKINKLKKNKQTNRLREVRSLAQGHRVGSGARM